jgi:tRNA A37 threonylcarbamoyladenosine modification protein TsaB
MILLIDSSQANLLRLSLTSKQVMMFDTIIKTHHTQSEKLLPLLEKQLTKHSLKLSDITRITVESRGEGFTNLRIGVTTANALGFALGIPVTPIKGKALKNKGITVVKPEYSRPPHITIQKSSKE